MEEFVTVSEMIERIKLLICSKCDKYPMQIDVAIELEIDHITLASIKKRNSTRVILPPIIKFCLRIGADPMKILF